MSILLGKKLTALLYYMFFRPLARDWVISGVCFYFNKDGNIEAHPGDNLPTIVNWDLTNIDSLKISSVNLKCNIDDPVLIRLHGANYDSGILVLKKGSSLTLDTKPLKGSYSELTISKNKSSGCDGIVISTSPKI